MRWLLLSALSFFCWPVYSMDLEAFLKKTLQKNPEYKIQNELRSKADLEKDSESFWKTSFAAEWSPSYYWKDKSSPQEEYQEGPLMSFALSQDFPLGIDAAFRWEDQEFLGLSPSQTKGWGVDVGLSLWPNFLGYRDRKLLGAATYEQKRAHQRSDLEKLSFCKKLIFLYSDLYYENIQKKLEEKRVLHARQIYQWARRSHRASKLRRDRYLSAEKNFFEAQVALRRLTAIAEEMKRKAYAYLGDKNLNTNALQNPMSVFLSFLLKENSAQSTNREIQEKKWSLESAKQTKSAAYLDRHPELKLKASYDQDAKHSTLFNSFDEDVFSWGLTLSWDFYTPQKSSQARKLFVEERLKSLELSRAQRDFEFKKENFSSNIQELKSELEIMKKLIQSNQELERISRKKLREGTLSFVDYNSIRSSLVESEDRFYQREFNVLKKSVEYLFFRDSLDAVCLI